MDRGCNFLSMAKLVSTRVLVAFLLITGACVDAKARFDDFGGRVNDAAPPADNPLVSEVADITGEFLLSLNALGSGAYIHYIAGATLNENDTGYAVDLEFRPLNYQTMELVPEVAPTTWSGLAVESATATFVIPLDGLLIPNSANPLINGDVTVNGEISATIRSTRFWCGTVTGQVVETGTMLNGSTFGAQRITPGTVGDALPPPAGSCNDEPMEADAGVPDAMPDAGEPDAGPDAGEPDAGPDAGEPDAA
jgi:hypothetical protein